MSDNGFVGKLERYQELERRRKELEERLDRAEQERGSVNEEIYSRVRKEYEGALEVVSQELDPLRAELDASHQEWTERLEVVEKRMQEISEKLEEIKFRHRVGEYDQNKFAELDTPLQREISELTGERGSLRDQIGLVEAVRKGAPARVVAEATVSRSPDSSHGFESFEDAPHPAHDDAMDGSSPFDEPAAPDSLGEDLVDPTTWTSELRSDSDRRRTERRSADRAETKPTTAEKPLSEFADPSAPGSAEIPDDTSVEPKERTSGFPILVITKGPGSGKKLPLMPMTMTLGREHDNNIELKDEDVARYHARIAFEDGRYVLEDLASTSGTFVNDEKVLQATLRHGDKLRVGTTEMIVDFE
jgi:hypothetical protein